MKKNTIDNLIGCIVNHKKLGQCEVIEVTNSVEGKFVAKVLKTNEVKKFIFSTTFFDNIDDYESVYVAPIVKKEKRVIYKEVNYEKNRNHPLVKEIDRREAGLRLRQLEQEESEEAS